MNGRQSHGNDGEPNPKWKFYEHSPGRDINAVKAWQRIFWHTEEEAVLEAEEIAHYAAHPAQLADTMATDLMTIEGDGLRCVYKNYGLWRQSPIFQTERYYRLFSALLPSCPVDFAVFLRHHDIVAKNLHPNPLIFYDPADAFDAVRTEVAFFATWLHATDRWDLPSIDDGNFVAKKSTTASFEDYAAAWAELESLGSDPKRPALRTLLKNKGKTLATALMTSYRQRLLKQRAGPS